MNCYKCNTILKNEWNYCPNCRRRLKKKKINIDSYSSCDEDGKCHVCSTLLSGSWYFCPICGTKIDLVGTRNRVNVPIIAGVEKDKKVIVPIEARFSHIQKNDDKVYKTDANDAKESVPVNDNEDVSNNVDGKKIDTEENREYVFLIFLAMICPLLSFVFQSPIISILFFLILPFVLLSYMKIAYRDVAIVNTIFRLYIFLVVLFLIFAIFFIDGWNTWFTMFG